MVKELVKNPNNPVQMVRKNRFDKLKRKPTTDKKQPKSLTAGLPPGEFAMLSPLQQEVARRREPWNKIGKSDEEIKAEILEKDAAKKKRRSTKPNP